VRVEATLKKYGKHYRYQFARMVLEGKTMMHTVHGELDKATPDAGSAVHDAFASYLGLADETQAMMDKEPAEREDGALPPMFSASSSA